MKLSITHQESYSRSELLLRTFFGFIYLVFPHIFLLIFVQIWGSILQFISFWVIMFTGRFPQSFFEYQEKTMRWNLRLNARVYNLTDGYPTFGLNGTDDLTSFEVPYHETTSRGTTLLVALFGGLYVGLPHGIILIFRLIGCAILNFLAFWSVLFTGNYPANWHKFIVETIRWSMRVNVYLMYMSPDYPPFHGREEEDETEHIITE